MTGPFSTATIIVGLLVAVWALVYLVMNKRVDRYLQLATLGLAAMFVFLAVGGIVQMMGTDKELARAEFVGYLVLSPLIPVGGWWWAKNDETRWGAGAPRRGSRDACPGGPDSAGVGRCLSARRHETNQGLVASCRCVCDLRHRSHGSIRHSNHPAT